MLARTTMIVTLAALALATVATPADACGRRSHTTYYWTSYLCPPDPCPPCPCPPLCPGPVYVKLGEPVPLNGPYPTPVLKAKFGKGIIVQVDAPTGTASHPTGMIQVIKTAGTGDLTYEGYNTYHVGPGKPGAPIRYSVFLLPTKPGPITVKIGFVMSDNAIVNVPFSFDVV